MAGFGMRTLVFCAVLWLGVAYGSSRTVAQEPPQLQAKIQAMAARIAGEVNNNISCNTDVLLLQQEIKRLTDKYEPKTPPEAPKQ